MCKVKLCHETKPLKFTKATASRVGKKILTCCTNWTAANLLLPTGIPWDCYCFYTPWNSPISSTRRQEVAPVSNAVNPISGFPKEHITELFSNKNTAWPCQFLPRALFLALCSGVSQILQSLLDPSPVSAPMYCLRRRGSTTLPSNVSRAAQVQCQKITPDNSIPSEAFGDKLMLIEHGRAEKIQA